MTQKQCMDAVKLRINQLNVSLSLDDQKIMNFINWGIRDVVTRTLPYHLEFYEVDNFNILGAANQQFPINMLGTKPIRVLATDPDTATTLEARYCTPNEFYTVAANTINPPANYAPIYTIWGDTTPNARVFRILPATIVTCVADIYQAPADLALDTSDYSTVIKVPASWEVAVVYATLYKCLQTLQRKDEMANAFKQYQEEVARLSPEKTSYLKSTRETLQSLEPLQEIAQS